MVQTLSPVAATCPGGALWAAAAAGSRLAIMPAACRRVIKVVIKVMAIPRSSYGDRSELFCIP
jgi:hypothetical protein